MDRSLLIGSSGGSGVAAVRPPLLWLVAVVGLAALGSACGGGPTSATGGSASGAVTPDRSRDTAESQIVAYSAIDSETGDVASLDDLRGRPVILASWATWCVPCRKELPDLERFHRTQGDDGVQVVIVNLDSAGNDNAIVEFVDRYDLTMTRWRDVDDEFTRVFRGLGIPMSVMLDREGRVAERWYGALDPDDDRVRERIEAVLADSA